MGLFKRTKKSASAAGLAPANTPAPSTPTVPAPGPPAIDPFFGDTELAAAVEALQAGDWRQAEQFLDARNDPNWTERVLRGSDIPLEVTTQWAEESPSCRSLCFKAASEIDAAWAARGSGFADTVSSGDAMVFLLRLRGAQTTLERAIEHDPSSPEPWGLMLTVGMGLGAEIEESQQRFDEAHRRMPFHTYSVRAMTNLLLEKWGGSEAQALEFARWVDAEAPADSPSRVAIGTAWYECGIMHALKRNHEGEGKGILVDMSTHLAGTGDEELFRSMARILDGLNDGVAPPAMVGALHMLLFLTGASDVDQARLVLRCVKAIDNRPSEHPWKLLGDPALKFQEQQQHAIRMATTQLEMWKRLTEIAAEKGIDLKDSNAA